MSQESIAELELNSFEIDTSTIAISEDRALILADVALIQPSDLQTLLARVAFASPIIAKRCHELADIQRTAIESQKGRVEQEKRCMQVITNPLQAINSRFNKLLQEKQSPSIQSIQLALQDIMDDITSCMLRPPSNSFQQLHDIHQHISILSLTTKFKVRECDLVPSMVRAMERLRDLDWGRYNHLKFVLPSRHHDWFPSIEEEYLRIWNGFFVVSNCPASDWEPLDQPAPTYINSYHATTQISPSLLLSLPSEILRLVLSFASDSTSAPRNSTSNDQRLIYRARSKLLCNVSLTHTSWTVEAQKEHLGFAFITSEKSFDKLANHLSEKKLTSSLRRLSLASFKFSSKFLARLSKLVKSCINLYHFELNDNFDARLLGCFTASNIKSAQFSNVAIAGLLDNWSHSHIRTLSLQNCDSRLPFFGTLPSLNRLLINGESLGLSDQAKNHKIYKSILNLSIDEQDFSNSLTSAGFFPHLETLTLYFNCVEQNMTRSFIIEVSDKLRQFSLLKSLTVKVGYQYLADKEVKERDGSLWGYDSDGNEYENSLYESDSDGEEEADPERDISFSDALELQKEIKVVFEQIKRKDFNLVCTVEDVRNWMM